VVAVGLLTAALSAFVPLAIALPLVVAVALALGGLVAGEAAGSTRVLGIALGATALALVLHLPWSLELALPGATWAPLGGAASSTPSPEVADLLRFQTGPLGGGVLSWALLGAAALPLVIGRSWRFAWAARAWMLAIVGWTLAVVAGADAVARGTGPAELALAPAAVGIALAAGLGVAAFESDLPGYRFGWRQVVSAVAGAALVAGALPVAGAAVDGRWDAPARGAVDVLAFLDAEERDVGPFRTLWLGDPAVLPTAGWQLDEGLAWGLTEDGTPTVLDRWAGSPDGTTLLVADAVDLAAGNETSRLGRLLAPMGVRYVVVVEADRPVADAAHRTPAPPAVVEALRQQLDLAPVEVDEGLQVFRNAAWIPQRAAVDAPDALVEPADAVEASPVLLDRDEVDAYEGEVPAGAIWTSTASADGWSLRVAGDEASRFEGFGWGNAFVVEEGGAATFEYSTPLSRRVLSGIQAAMWAAAGWWLLSARRRRRSGTA
jgi:hypothetical protein